MDYIYISDYDLSDPEQVKKLAKHIHDGILVRSILGGQSVAEANTTLQSISLDIATPLIISESATKNSDSALTTQQLVDFIQSGKAGITRTFEDLETSA